MYVLKHSILLLSISHLIEQIQRSLSSTAADKHDSLSCLKGLLKAMRKNLFVNQFLCLFPKQTKLVLTLLYKKSHTYFPDECKRL